MNPNRRSFKGVTATGALALILVCSSAAHAQSVLRLVPQADLKILDTVQTTNNITSNHGYMIYDTLFSLDSKFMPKPQMVESHTRSADGLTWTFKLRPGLKFHDGQPVTAKDAVASIVRFSKRIPAGVTMMQFTKEIVATGADTFEIRLSRPFGLVLETLAGPENPLFITSDRSAVRRVVVADMTSKAWLDTGGDAIGVADIDGDLRGDVVLVHDANTPAAWLRIYRAFSNSVPSE